MATSADARAVELYTKGEGQGPDHYHRFQFSYENQAKNQWNFCAINWLTDAFFLCLDRSQFQAHDLPQLSRIEIYSRMVNKFKYLRELWRRNQLPTSDKEVVEKERKAQARQATRQQTVSFTFYCAAHNNAHKHEKTYQQRLEACERARQLRQYLPLIEGLGVQGMSEDETDTEETPRQPDVQRKRVRILQADWRNPELERIMRTIDKDWRGMHMPFRGKRGNTPSERISVAKRNSEKVPSRIPENLYNSLWLRKLDPYMRARLRMKPSIQLPPPL